MMLLQTFWTLFHVVYPELGLCFESTLFRVDESQ